MNITRPRLGLAVGPGAIPFVIGVVAVRAAHAQLGLFATALLFTTGVAALGVNLVWSWVAVRRAVVDVVAAPADATVGDVVPCDIELAGAVGPVTVTMTTASNAPVASGSNGRTTLPALAGQRCIAVGAGFDIRASRPFGLVGVRRVLRLQPLPEPLHISPKPVPWPDGLAAARRAATTGSDDLRAVRPYLPGDSRRLVHWPTTARAGTLIVRELEPPRHSLTVLVDLGDGHKPRLTEHIASLAAWVLLELVRTGAAVRLVTGENGDALVGEVVNDRDVGRRLAAATPGPRVVAPDGWEPTMVIRL